MPEEIEKEQSDLAKAAQSDATKEFVEHARSLIRGKTEPKNELSAHFVGKLQAVTAEHQALLANIQSTEQQLARAKQEAQKYEGALEAFLQALQLAESA